MSERPCKPFGLVLSVLFAVCLTCAADELQQEQDRVKTEFRTSTLPFLQKYFEQSAEADAMTAEEYAKARGQYIASGKGRPPAGAIPPPESP